MTCTRRKHYLRALTQVPTPTARLVCFPHAGGTAGIYSPWTAALPSAIELLAAQYPGHGDRFGEQPRSDVRAMSSEIVPELLLLRPLPTVFFGHSLGALVAYETAVGLSTAGRLPSSLLLSSCLPPGAHGKVSVQGLSDRDLWSMICSLGGTDPSVTGDTDLAEALLPSLRADIAAHERYRPEPVTAPLSCRVRCYHGLQDPLVDGAALRGWASITTGPFSLCVREGCHFHPFQNAHGLLADILDLLYTDSLTRS